MYRVNGMVIKDDFKFTKPKPLPAAEHDFFSLKTNDIEGRGLGGRRTMPTPSRDAAISGTQTSWATSPARNRTQ